MIAFRVDAEMYREVEAAARRDERAMAQFVRRVLNEYLTATGQKG
jgi:predicted HicB family RNase H-like nuclease